MQASEKNGSTVALEGRIGRRFDLTLSEPEPSTCPFALTSHSAGAFSFKLRCGIILPTLNDPDRPNTPHSTT